MGSEQNKGTSFTPSEPKLCANGCGFFGTAGNMNLCSKCYRDFLVKEEQAASAKAAIDKSLNLKSSSKQSELAETVQVAEPIVGSSSVSVDASQQLSVGSVSDQAETQPEPQPQPQPKAAGRCLSCKKKVGLTGFKCKCGSTFCGIHRYPEKHDCMFDFKGSGRDAIAKANPVVRADKLDRI